MNSESIRTCELRTSGFPAPESSLDNSVVADLELVLGIDTRILAALRIGLALLRLDDLA